MEHNTQDRDLKKSRLPSTDTAVGTIYLEDKEDVEYATAQRQQEQDELTSKLDGEQETIRRVKRRLDIRIIFTLAICNLWSFIDRGNLGNAYIAGMNKDLNLLIGNRYSILTMIFFVPYIIFNAPSTYIVRKLGSTAWIPTMVVCCGVVTIAQGFCRTWGPLIVCRTLLGAIEGGIISPCIFLIGVWYTRYEAHRRLAGFYVIALVATGFSGLLAYGIEEMNGLQNIAGWRWIFIIEGVATCACGLLAYFTLVELPERATKRNFMGLKPFLTAEEAEILRARIQKDRGDSEAVELTVRSMLACLKDWKVWEFTLYICLNNTAVYAFAYFLPIILQEGLKYSVSKAQLYTFPPYAVAMPWILCCAWFADRMRFRGPVLIFNSSLYIVGTAMMGFAKNNGTRYAGVFLGIMGILANIPTIWAYQHNNIVGQTKRAVCAAIMTMGGAVGGIIAGNIFQAKDRPQYKGALIACMTCQAVALLLVAKNIVVFRRANRKADRGECVIEGMPDFRHTY